MFCSLISKQQTLKLSQSLWCNPNLFTNKNYYGFSRMVTKTQKREYKRNEGKFVLTPYTKDDLYYTPVNETPDQFKRQGIDKLAYEYVKNPDTHVDKKGICMLIYNVAKQGNPEDTYAPVFSQLEQHLYKFKEQYSSRLVFGGLYGAYKTNGASQYVIQYFEDEFYRVKKDIVGLEFINLIEALSHNKAKTEKKKHQFINKHIKSELLQKFDEVKFNSSAMQNLLFSIARIQYFDKELCEKLLAQVCANKSVRNVKKIVQIYETLVGMEKSGKFFRSLQPEIDNFKDRLTKRKDHSWLYDAENIKYHTYAEVKQKANDFTEKDKESQQVGFWLYKNSDKLQQYFDNKQNIKKVEAEIENKAKKQELDNLMFEKFQLENIGEDTGREEGDEKVESESNFHTLSKTQTEQYELNEKESAEINSLVEEEFKSQQAEMEQMEKKSSKKNKKNKSG